MSSDTRSAARPLEDLADPLSGPAGLPALQFLQRPDRPDTRAVPVVRSQASCGVPMWGPNAVIEGVLNLGLKLCQPFSNEDSVSNT